MSEARVMLCGAGLDPAQSARSLELLEGISLPDAAKFVITSGKFDARGVASTVNIEASYPAEPLHLLSLAAWAETTPADAPQFRDGFDLFCLRAVVNKHPGFDYAVLLHDCGALAEAWPRLRSAADEQQFVIFDEHARPSPTGANLAVRLSSERWPLFADMTAHLYASGAAYALHPYSLEAALRVARAAAEVCELLETERAFAACGEAVISSAAWHGPEPFLKVEHVR